MPCTAYAHEDVLMDLAPTGDLTRDTAVARIAPDRYEAVIRDGYGAGDAVPNGGLLLSIAARAMAAASQRPSLVTVTGQFLRRAQPGAAVISVEILRAGRLVMTRAQLEQEGQTALHATGVFADRATLPQRTWVTSTPPELPAPDACVPPGDGATGGPHWAPPPVSQRLEHRMPPDQLQFALGSPNSHAAIKGWYRPLVGHADETAVPFLMDALFPPAFTIAGPVGFAPTIELTVQLRRPPGHGWLRYRFATRAIAGGVMEEDGELWTAGGELVALSRQTALPTG
jgi:acyl-CoA thioesterase